MNIFQMFRRLFIFKLYTQEYEEWSGQSTGSMYNIIERERGGGYE